MATPLAGPTRGPRPAAVVSVSRLRPRGAWLRLLAIGLLVAGCAGAGSAAKDRPELSFGPEADVEATARRIAERARTAEVVYLGELHDNAQHHLIQARPRGDHRHGQPARARVRDDPETGQAALEAAVRERRGARRDRQGSSAGPRRAGPTSRCTWPPFELARKHRLPVVGTDLDPAVARRVGRGGACARREATLRGYGRRCPTISRATAASSSGSRRRTAVRSARTARTGCSRAGTRATW